jgi:hypothetical protein
MVRGLYSEYARPAKTSGTARLIETSVQYLGVGKVMGKGGYLREGQPVIVQQCSKKLKMNSTHKMCARVQKYSFHEFFAGASFLFHQGCGAGARIIDNILFGQLTVRTAF